jgi:hypothetical protein
MGVWDNQSVARTDKSQKPHFLCLTGGLRVTVLTKIDVSGDIPVTECHAYLEEQVSRSPL